MGTTAKSARAPLKELLRENNVGEGVEESKAADAQRWIRLCCCLIEKRVRRGEETDYDRVK